MNTRKHDHPPHGREDETPAARLRRYIGPDDWALVIGLKGTPSPPKDFGSWADFGFGKRTVFGSIDLSDEQKDALGAYPIAGKTESAWRLATRLIESSTAEVARSCGSGRIHVFFVGPHAAAAYLGRQLDTRARSKEIFVHHFDRSKTDWFPFVLPESLVARDGREPYFQNLEQPPVVKGQEGGWGYGMSLEGRREAGDRALEDVAMRERLGRIYRAIPANDWALTSPGQVMGALEQVVGLLDRLRDKLPSQPLHLFTSLPVSLVVGLAMRLPDTVWTRVVVHQYRPGADSSVPQYTRPGAPFYYPVLDVIRGELMATRRRRLEVFTGDGGFLMYRLDGNVLPAARALKHPAPLDRRSADRPTLMVQAKTFSESVLPPPVDKACGDWNDIDVEINVQGAAAELPWEFLMTAKQDDFIAWRLGCTVTRVLGTDARIPSRQPVEPLRVLIVPVIPQKQREAYRNVLGLGRIVDLLTSRGVQCRVLETGLSDQEVADQIDAFRPHILQWIGHGGQDDQETYPPVAQVDSDGGPTYLDRLLIRRILGGSYRPLIVFFASCELGAEVSDYGVPRDFVREGVGAVISYRDKVTFREVGTFSRVFYDQVTQGESLGEAVRAARQDLYREGLNEKLLPGAFGAPVLTCSDPSVLKPLMEAPAGSSSQEEVAPDGTTSSQEGATASGGEEGEGGGDIGMTGDPGDGELELH